MRNKLPLVSSLLLFPLLLGVGVAAAAAQQGAGNFKLVLSDGSVMQGAISFVVSLDTQYGMIKISSSSMASARFDPAGQWADIRLNEAELKLKYKPGTSDIKATTSAGPINIDLAKVITIDNGTVPPPGGAYSSAANQANVPPPPAYAQQPPSAYAQQPPVVVAPPTSAYPYAQPAQPYYATPPYYSETVPDYYPDYGYYYGGPPVYGYPYYGYGWGWPSFGIGFGWGRGFGFGGFRGGFRGGFHGGFGGGFHGGFGHGGHR